MLCLFTCLETKQWSKNYGHPFQSEDMNSCKNYPHVLVLFSFAACCVAKRSDEELRLSTFQRGYE